MILGRSRFFFNNKRTASCKALWKAKIYFEKAFHKLKNGKSNQERN